MKIYNPFKVDIPDNELRSTYNRNRVESSFNRELGIIQAIENKMNWILIGYVIIAYALMNNLFITHLIISFTAVTILYGVLYKIFTNSDGVYSVTNFFIKQNIYYTPINSLLTHAPVRKLVSLAVLLHLGEKLYFTNFYKLYFGDFPAHTLSILVLFVIIQLDFHFNHLKRYQKLSSMLQEAEELEQKQYSLMEQTDEERERIQEEIEKYIAKKSTTKVIEFKAKAVKRRKRNINTQNIKDENN
ncbi:MAG: hypothetical protein N4A57_07970 [Anaeromicrobium sp.]|jgi:uncharacterized membrane protein|uniref:hypothetical protein n=1 Tax=Anaeromicrobium sp. TaxID=1929132 RepID=UPI0025CE74BD|nr:hypothetical protein [Anaeromicrobium sp.]MCT4594187.1 hypothetical protein [Anaeromicrobium sp.]